MEDIKCIDFSLLGSLDDSKDNEEWTKIIQEVVNAFHNIGFVYIKNHGIPKALIKKIHEKGQEFFFLPEEIKLEYVKKPHETQGYVQMNREVFNKTDSIQELRESYNIYDPEGQFPTEIKDFKQTVNDIINEGTKLAIKLLKCLEIGLDLPKGRLLEKHKKPFSDKNGSLLRILNYPPIPDGVTEGTVRCGAHTDYGTFTLLFQDDCGGLEVKRRDDQWVNADPITDTVLVNVGDLLQMWTAGKLIATEHRVRVPKEEILRRCSRKSVVLFFHPEHDTVVKPLDGSDKYPPVLAGQHLKNRYDYTFVF